MILAELIFLVLAAISVVSGVCVIAFRQPIKSVLALVVVMLSLSILFLLLEAQFVFIVQVIVYAGAVMVLFLFVVALLGPMREAFTRRLGRWHLALALLVALVFFGMLYAILGDITYRSPKHADLSTFGSVEAIGAGLFGLFLYPFELTSVLLVVAAIGAIYMSRGGRDPRGARGQRDRTRLSGGFPQVGSDGRAPLSADAGGDRSPAIRGGQPAGVGVPEDRGDA